ncbi:MAG: hypothetical protein M1828_002359 [Chrysothrix sp. TS-e1954]|nr:MAG: hypothetical protein M1828_002359 [Chrysothrix sp. TS-e1954]
MATATQIALDLVDAGEYSVPYLSQSSAQAASEILNENHEKHDIIFTDFGLHNHIAHHVLTVYGLGAKPDTIRKHYEHNASYQRPPRPRDDSIADQLQDPTFFLQELGKRTTNYPNYLELFIKEIREKGYERVCHEYLFAGDSRANVMFARLCSGTLHPFIHLGFGIEFRQPAIVAEALGQTAIHPTWLDSFFFDADEAAKKDARPSRSMVAILDSMNDDEALKDAPRWTDKNNMRDGVIARAQATMVEYASQWRVGTEDLDAAAAELINAASYFTMTAQKPPKQVKFDFYFMHSVTSSIFLPLFMKQDWISVENKAKILEYKGRTDLCQYASRRSPNLLMSEIEDYIPRRVDASDWTSIVERAIAVDDDGHASKLVRALARGQQICGPFEERHEFRIKKHMWLKMGNMAIDSVEDDGKRWVRSAGFIEAWERYVSPKFEHELALTQHQLP